LEGAGIQPGQTIKIQGIPRGDKFEIAFIAGSNVQNNDLPLIIDVMKSENCMMFNDRKNGKLGKHVDKKDPFKSVDKIDLRLRLQEDRLQVFANLKFFTEFEYRQPLTSITHVNISGEIELTNVSWGGKHYPVPLKSGIDGNFTVGRKLYITGIPEKKAKAFYISLLNSKGDTVFHMSPRFSDKDTILNAKLDGNWGKEEKIDKFPFKADTFFAHSELFDIMIIHEEHAFQIYIDGEHYCAFGHRAPAQSINQVSIEGDIELFSVNFK